MNLKQVGYLIGFSSLFFLAYLIRPSLLGADTYYFASISCYGDKVILSNLPFLADLFFKIIPCNEFFFKLLTYFFFTINILLISLIGEKINKEHGWLAGILINMSSFFLLANFQLEDDVLSYPLLLISLYLILNKGGWGKVAALILVLIAGLFWRGSFFWLFGFALGDFLFFFALIIVFVFLLNNDFGTIIGAVFPNNQVIENVPFFGIIQQYVLLLGFWGAKRFLTVQFIFWGVLTFFNMKFAPMLSIFLVLGFVLLIGEYNRDKKIFKNEWLRKHFFDLIIAGVLGIGFANFIIILNYSPNENQINAIQDVIILADGQPILNDWSYGHYIAYYGGVPMKKGGGPEIPMYKYKAIITERDINGFNDCEIKFYDKGFNDYLKVISCE